MTHPERCGECGLPLWPVGTGVYCANTACSMYARESSRQYETYDLPGDAPRIVRTLHLEVVTHDAKPARTV